MGARAHRRVEVMLGVLAAVLLVHGGDGRAATGAEWRAGGDGVIRLVSAAQPITLTGRLHVIRNGEARFFLVDDRGVATRLIIDESLLKALGGLRGFEQRRVSIEGQDEPPGVVRVLSIGLETKAK